MSLCCTGTVVPPRRARDSFYVPYPKLKRFEISNLSDSGSATWTRLIVLSESETPVCWRFHARRDSNATDWIWENGESQSHHFAAGRLGTLSSRGHVRS